MDFFNASFWTFRNIEFQNTKKKSKKNLGLSQKMWLVYRVFGRFVTRGVKKTRYKKIARKSPQLPTKTLTHLRHFFFFFSRRPLSQRRCIYIEPYRYAVPGVPHVLSWWCCVCVYIPVYPRGAGRKKNDGPPRTFAKPQTNPPTIRLFFPLTFF
jgi:hypothetical protein